MRSRRSSLVVMMQPTHLWDFADRANLRPLDRPRHRTIHVQCPVRAPVMIVVKVFDQEPPQVSLVQDDHVIQAFAADTPDEALHVGILPRTPRGDHDLHDAHVPHPLPKGGAIDAVPVAQEITWRFVPRQRVHHLLRCPLCRRMFRDVEMHDAAPCMAQAQQYEEYFMGSRRHDKEIQGD